jgi:hypothetical protein
MHNIIVGTDSCFDSLLHQETGLAVFVINLVFIQIEPYLYTSLVSFYKREGNFSIGKDIHGYINKGFGLIDIFDDGFLGIVREGEVDFGFGKGGNRYSYRKNDYEKNKNTKLSIPF